MCGHECHCNCHRTGAKHAFACCRECRICGKNIDFTFFDNHMNFCHCFIEQKINLSETYPKHQSEPSARLFVFLNLRTAWHFISGEFEPFLLIDT